MSVTDLAHFPASHMEHVVAEAQVVQPVTPVLQATQVLSASLRYHPSLQVTHSATLPSQFLQFVSVQAAQV